MLKARAGHLFSQAFSRRNCLVSRLLFLSVNQASLPRGVLEIILSALLVSARRRC